MKTNKTNIQKKLKTYSALAGTFAAAMNSADAQVMYTNVAPDDTLNAGEMFNLDLNNDAIADFKLLQKSGVYASYFSYDAVAVYALNAPNAIDTAGGNGTAAAFDAGVRIDQTLNWVDSMEAALQTPAVSNGLALYLPAFGQGIGNFVGVTGKFLPLRFDVGTARYYGWVRLDVAADARSFTVIDYAYTNYLNAFSITGDMVGISESALNNKVNIYSYDKAITVELDAAVSPEGTIIISDISGKKISETSISATKMNIPVNEAKTGVYLVTINQTNGSYTKRVFVK
ncbi:MAG: hypothetical protein K0Q95_2498 [Bacteroidota bacterium]|jgi:hypothetical protein|nr:hypothetical protein [Bacteroidota bacterium]